LKDKLETPYVVSYFFNGLLTARSRRNSQCLPGRSAGEEALTFHNSRLSTINPQPDQSLVTGLRIERYDPAGLNNYRQIISAFSL